jgi:glycosyltransferase involved in cell wall biosynthesis
MTAVRTQGGGTVLIAAAGWHDEHPGGANRLPTDFARFLAKRGHHVTYLCASGGTDRTTATRIDGVQVWRYRSPIGPSPSVGNVRQHWRSAREIAAAVDRERPVTALLGHTQLQYLAAAGACGDAVRRCYAVHSPFVAELREGVTGRPTLKQRAAWAGAAWMERRILAVSDVIHYDSAFTGRLMEAAYPREIGGKGLVLPGWVDVVRFRPPVESRALLRRRLGPPWDPLAITFFSLRRLVPRMGLDTLIAAAAELARSGRSFRIVLGGEGPERANLEALAAASGIADRVAFLGRVPDARLADCFGAADCFVLPTRALECFGLIVLESFACGVPVVGVPVGSIPEVMGPALRAWIAADNQAPALAGRMEDFLTGRLAANPIALRNRAMEFAFESVAVRHERVLLNLEAEGAVA